jgi:MerR family transcriptional regulator, heat shock protein HspR
MASSNDDSRQSVEYGDQRVERGDDAAAVRPQRTPGGRRRYSRRQLAFAARIRELFDQGHTLAAALRILDLEDDLAAERALTARLHERLGERDGPDG